MDFQKKQFRGFLCLLSEFMSMSFLQLYIVHFWPSRERQRVFLQFLPQWCWNLNLKCCLFQYLISDFHEYLLKNTSKQQSKCFHSYRSLDIHCKMCSNYLWKQKFSLFMFICCLNERVYRKGRAGKAISRVCFRKTPF